MRKIEAPTSGPALTSNENKMVDGFVDGFTIDRRNTGLFPAVQIPTRRPGPHRISRTAPVRVNEKFSGPTFLSTFIHFYRPNLHFYDSSFILAPSSASLGKISSSPFSAQETVSKAGTRQKSPANVHRRSRRSQCGAERRRRDAGQRL